MGVLPTAGGKTRLIASIAQEHVGLSCIGAHRQELVMQIAMALAECGVHHRIIASDKLVRFIARIQQEELGKSWVHGQAHVAVVSVDTLLSRAETLRLWTKQVTLVQMDEGHHCFPAGTFVRTHDRDVPIELLEVGDTVMSGNGNFEVVRALMKSPIPTMMIEIHFAHHELRCTSEHPIWTKHGWTKAGDLTEDDHVYVHAVWHDDFADKRTSALSVPQDGQYFLYDQMRDDMAGCSTQSPETQDEVLHGLWCGNDTSLSYGPVPDMCESTSSASGIRNDGGNQSATRIVTNEIEQPNEECDISSKNDTKHDRASPDHSRREWQTNATSRSNVDFALWNETSIHGGQIQGGCRTPASQIGDRSGRQKSRGTDTTRTRPQERRSFAWVRVDRVKVYESSNSQGNPKRHHDGYVYNLEVSGSHTFIAGGAVVHNCLAINKWGHAHAMFSNAKSVLWTATPRRSDRKSLRLNDGGICTDMVLGPTMRELMNQGYLCLYTVFGPPPSIDRDKLVVGSTGDYTQNSVQTESNRSQIVGDLHDHYFKLTPGKRALGFMVDVKQAFELAERFRASGMRAVAMSAEHTSDDQRVANMRSYRRGDLDIVVNCDLFGEGTDVPGVEVILDGAPTMSTPRFMQRLGRLLRTAPGKSRGFYIDAAGNYISFVERHGCLPEDVTDWSLDVPARRKRLPNDEHALTACPACYLLRERYKPRCPYCGFKPEPKGRQGPKQVDGDLMEYDEALLKLLNRKADEIMMPAPEKVAPFVRDNWEMRRRAQADLRTVLSWWGGIHARDDLSEAWRLFYNRFGVDVATAKTYSGPEAQALSERVWNDIDR